MTVDEIIDIFEAEFPDHVVHRIYEAEPGKFIITAPPKVGGFGFNPFTYLLTEKDEKVVSISPTEAMEHWSEWVNDNTKIYDRYLK